MSYPPKGYYIPCGYMGWVGDKYQLFPTEDEYIEYISN